MRKAKEIFIWSLVSSYFILTGIYRTNAELESKINKNSQIARDFYDKYKYLLSKEDETAIKKSI